MSFQEIPIDSVENQTFEVVMRDKKYNLTIIRNRLHDFYTLTIKLNNEVLLANFKLTFNRNILDGFQVLNIGSRLGLYNVDKLENPSFEDFGAGVKLIYED